MQWGEIDGDAFGNLTELLNSTNPRDYDEEGGQPPPAGSITVGAGPALGAVNGVTNYQEFTDWTLDDLIALDDYNNGGSQAVDIYRRDFWQRVRGDELPREFAFQALDAAVNHGIGNAVRWMQRAAGVADDGVIGPVTLAAVQRAQPADLVLRFNAERLRFYAKLTTFGTFGRGWVNRVAGNLDHAAADN